MRNWMWGLALAGCGVANDGELALGELQQALSLPLAAFELANPADRDAGARPRVRFIAQAVAGPGGWECSGSLDHGTLDGYFESGFLFAEGSLASIPTMPDIFKSYCVIEWVPAGVGKLPQTSQVENMLENAEARFGEVIEDLRVVAPQDEELDSATQQELVAYYREFMGQLQPLPDPEPNTSLAKIRIAVADTSPFSDYGGPNVGTSSHGLAMGRLAQVFACPIGEHCPGFITHHLALPRSNDNTKPPLGGYYGFRTETARAIAEAVMLWETKDENEDGLPDERHLVINLSLGWEDRSNLLASATPANFLLPDRAVYEALNYAACRGALVVVAAGNRTGGPDELTGPLYPAGFETRPAPSNATCQARFGVPATEAGSGNDRALVYAVGGVRYDDRELAHRRTAGRPRLAAGGFQVNVGLGESGGNVSAGVFSGTSSAAAAVSGIAAALWAYRPSLDRHTLMRGIYNQGVSLDPAPSGADVRAEFCRGTNCGTQPVRRANLCAAWKAMCQSGEEACPSALVACTPRPAYSGTMQAALEPAVPDIEAAAGGRDHVLLDASVLIYTNQVPPECGFETDGRLYHAPGAPNEAAEVSACPATQFYLPTATPWSAPQPWGGLCPTCYGIKNPAGTMITIKLYTNAAFNNNTFYNGTVSFKGDTGVLSAVPIASINPVYASFQGGDVMVLTGVPFPPGTTKITFESLTNTPGGTASTFSELAWW